MNGHGESESERAIFYDSTVFVELKWIRPRLSRASESILTLTSKFITLKPPYLYDVVHTLRS